MSIDNNNIYNELINNAIFEIGGDDKLVDYYSKLRVQQEEEKSSEGARKLWIELLADIQIRVGSLLKTNNLSFLFGAGASVDCGGVLIGTVPIDIEKQLVQKGCCYEGQDNNIVQEWLKYFYLAVREVSQNKNDIPFLEKEIIERKVAIDTEPTEAAPLEANYEHVLSTLYRWRSAIPELGGSIQIGNSDNLFLKSEEIDKTIHISTCILKNCCQLPVQEKKDGLNTFQMFIKKILTRPLNLKRSNIFTLNYDTLIEQATDGEGVILIDGFIGTLRRVFRPECYEQDLYFPAETTEGRVYRHDRVIHLYKLHGSITWSTVQPEWNNPYGLQSRETTNNDDAVIIYPTPLKFGETLGMPYAELFRRFAEIITRPQSTLFVFGYGFGDEHVNAIIRQALAVPSFTLVVVDPKPQNVFVQALKERKDKRVWVFSGKELGSFSKFVEYALPDLRDEDIHRDIIATQRALKKDYLQNLREGNNV